MQTVRYYGHYSNKARVQRARTEADQAANGEGIVIDDEDTPYRKLCRMRWAALIKRVYEVDPLKCPECGGSTAIISFIEKRDQADVIQKILKHCGLPPTRHGIAPLRRDDGWDRPATRAPPENQQPADRQPTLELQYVDEDEFLMAL